MKLAIVYYSKTGNTLKVVEVLKKALADANTPVDIYKVSPAVDYSKPLHLNPRILYDTLVKKGTEIKIEPDLFKVDEYACIAIASPIWINTLAPPILGFLKRYKLEGKQVIVITTSALPINCSRIEKVLEKMGLSRPKLCINITASTIKDEQKLRQHIYAIAKRILEYKCL